MSCRVAPNLVGSTNLSHTETTDLRHGLTTRNHGDLVDGIMVREQGANDGMARFMVGNEFLRGIVLVIKKKNVDMIDSTSLGTLLKLISA